MLWLNKSMGCLLFSSDSILRFDSRIDSMNNKARHNCDNQSNDAFDKEEQDCKEETKHKRA